MARAEITSAVTEKCGKTAERMGFELVEVSLDREPTGKYLRVYIDKPEGITLDDCEQFHRAVLPMVEQVDYDFMEVSSPGIDRPLKTDRDFERNLGAEVEVRLFSPLDGKKAYSGVLAGYDRENLLLETDGEEKAIPRKSAALVRPVVDMEGVEEVSFDELEGNG